MKMGLSFLCMAGAGVLQTTFPLCQQGSQPTGGSTGRLESWKRSMGLHLPVCFLFLFLFPVPVSITLVSVTQQSTESLFQWQQLISLCSFSSTHGSGQRAPFSETPTTAKQSPSSEVRASALLGASSERLKL